ncbi:MAG: YihY/virulence factor BrkB family protein [Verrucomicrobia bacterium]|nr:YihY/virulence factor BrkB family protein [Verrucomicrobiota bacterium]
MAIIVDSKNDHQPHGWEHLRALIRTRISVWVGLAALAGWLLSHIPPKRGRAYAHGNKQDTSTHAGEIAPVSKFERSRSGGGLLPLALELLGAVVIRLVRRYLKSWSSRLIVRLENSPGPKLSSGGLGDKIGPRSSNTLSDHRSETPSEQITKGEPYQKGIVSLFKNTASEWIQDKCPQLGAALAYFTVFSLAPLVLVLLAVFGLIFGGSDQARQKITEQLQYLIDPAGIKVIQDIAANAAKPQSSIIATGIGVVVALFGASGVFGQLQEALNTIWGVKPKPGGGLLAFIRTRFLSFAMVGGVCFLLLVSLTLETLIRGLNNYLKSVMPGGDIVALALFLLLDLAVIVLLFAMIFRYLPDAKIAWSDVWVGATLTALLFALGKFVLGLYLGSGAAGSAYGAASSLVTLLLWIYYASLILLFGAEFTQVYANTYGTRLEPAEHAVKVEITEKAVSS